MMKCKEGRIRRCHGIAMFIMMYDVHDAGRRQNFNYLGTGSEIRRCAAVRLAYASNHTNPAGQVF